MQVIFYKSKEHKNHYLIYKGGNSENPQRMLQKITHTGEFTDSGYGHLEIEFGFSLLTEAADNFIDFLVEQVASNHIENPEYDNTSFRSWYEFKDIKSMDKWQNDFYSFQKQRQMKFQKASGMQTAMF